ncbi:MAG: hypothetical protein CO094_04745 [Anaerolineae bacterium CG_4_9_14_3_um_filter_57_17]|nr:MAG: hypothetical protein CO094_04745 [Anaerolineae bacterium CG_4_9_14_3_um_filter_57_17]
MAASPAEPPVVARAFGGRILCDAHHPGPASHDGAGGRFVFVPAADATGYAYALDVEPRTRPCPAAIAKALGCGNDSDEALRRWTELEVTAKLTETPVHLLLLAQSRPVENEIQMIRCDTDSHWIAVGMRK